jgi:hypothetical protein
MIYYNFKVDKLNLKSKVYVWNWLLGVIWRIKMNDFEL